MITGLGSESDSDSKQKKITKKKKNIKKSAEDEELKIKERFDKKEQKRREREIEERKKSKCDWDQVKNEKMATPSKKKVRPSLSSGEENMSSDGIGNQELESSFSEDDDKIDGWKTDKKNKKDDKIWLRRVEDMIDSVDISTNKKLKSECKVDINRMLSSIKGELEKYDEVWIFPFWFNHKIYGVHVYVF